jgi:hypothetical protein
VLFYVQDRDEKVMISNNHNSSVSAPFTEVLLCRLVSDYSHECTSLGPAEPSGVGLGICLSNYWKLKENPSYSAFNMRIDNINEVVNEICVPSSAMRGFVDCSTPCSGRNQTTLQNVAERIVDRNTNILFCCSPNPSLIPLKEDSSDDSAVKCMVRALRQELLAGNAHSSAGLAEHGKDAGARCKACAVVCNFGSPLARPLHGSLTHLQLLQLQACGELHKTWTPTTSTSLAVDITCPAPNTTDVLVPPIVISLPPHSTNQLQILEHLQQAGAKTTAVVFNQVALGSHQVDHWRKILSLYGCTVCVDCWGYSSTFTSLSSGISTESQQTASTEIGGKRVATEQKSSAFTTRATGSSDMDNHTHTDTETDNASGTGSSSLVSTTASAHGRSVELNNNECKVFPNDYDMLMAVSELCARGHASQICLSLAIFCKIQLRAYGGHGYSYVQDVVRPNLKVLLAQQVQQRPVEQQVKKPCWSALNTVPTHTATDATADIEEHCVASSSPTGASICSNSTAHNSSMLKATAAAVTAAAASTELDSLLDKLCARNLRNLVCWRPEPPPVHVAVEFLTCHICAKKFVPGNHYSKFSFEYCSSKCLTQHRKANWI